MKTIDDEVEVIFTITNIIINDENNWWWCWSNYCQPRNVNLRSNSLTRLPRASLQVFSVFAFCYLVFVSVALLLFFPDSLQKFCLSPPFNFCSFPVFLFLFFSFNFSDSLVYSWSLVILSFDNCLHKQTSFFDLHCFSTTKQWWAKGPLLFNSW